MVNIAWVVNWLTVSRWLPHKMERYFENPPWIFLSKNALQEAFSSLSVNAVNALIRTRASWTFTKTGGGWRLHLPFATSWFGGGAGCREVPSKGKKKRLLGWCGSSSRCLCSIFRSRRKKKYRTPSAPLFYETIFYLMRFSGVAVSWF